MARFTIIILLVCLGVLGYLYYDKMTDQSVYNTLQTKIQRLETENERLKGQKTKIAPPIVVERPIIKIKKAEPLINRQYK